MKGLFALLTTPTYLTNALVRQSMNDLAAFMGRTTLLTDTIADVAKSEVEVLFWQPEHYDATLFTELKRYCSNIVFLARPVDKTQTIHRSENAKVIPGIIWLGIPFVIEEAAYILTHAFHVSMP